MAQRTAATSAGSVGRPQRKPSGWPLSTKLSLALVAFTIECDNEFERALLGGQRFAAWKANKPPVFLVSLAMWANYLRHLAEGPLAAHELAALAGGDDDIVIARGFTGLRRWRYVAVEPAPSGKRRDALVQLTAAGHRCARLWQPLPAAIEARWRARFGESVVDKLRQPLAAAVARFGGGRLWCLPIISSRREMFSPTAPQAKGGDAPDGLPLIALLSQALLAFTLAFEQGASLPLPIVANALRTLDPTGMPLRDLPTQAGISAAAIAQSLTLLQRHGVAEVVPTAGSRRGRHVRLTAEGVTARRSVQRRIASVERNWRQQLGAAHITALHDALDAVVGRGDPTTAPLATALAAPAGTWRSALAVPRTLPHHPIPLDRGGWPDGA